MPLAPGTRLGPYEILAPIGAGGMGEVYRAKDTKLGRDVALKVLPEAFASDPERMARFEREAQVLAALNHPNIAAIYGVEERALVMEFVEGENLQGPLPIETALDFAKQIAEALEAAHEKGIVHRDLKPANIKITPQGVVKVLDFGLAAVTQNADSGVGNPVSSPTLTMRATQAGMIMGTAAYMSPEQASGKPVDRRADIWSFGVVLWEMLTGHLLFQGETISHTLADVLRGDIDLNKLPPETPAGIRDLLRRCLDRDAKNRLRDIGEARIRIQKYLADPAGGSEVALAAKAHPTKLPWAVAAVATMVALALGFVAFRHVNEETRVLKVPVLLPEKATLSPAGSVPAISPDGRRLAFAAIRDGKTELWVRDLDSLAARVLPGTEGASYPFWSPDSHFLAFFADRKLKRIDPSGGPVLTLCDVAGARGGSWGKRDVIVFTPNVTGSLLRIPAGGGAATPATALDQTLGEVSHRFPSFLPDGRHFLYAAGTADLGRVINYVGDLDSNERRPAVEGRSNVIYAPPGYLLFLRSGTLMAQLFDADTGKTNGDAVPIAEQVSYGGAQALGHFSASQNGVLAYYVSGATGRDAQLTWFDRSGKVTGAVGTHGTVGGPAISPDGITVAVGRADAQTGFSDIWLHDLKRGTASRFTSNSRFNISPVWSPDGREIAFYSSTGAGAKMYRKAISGTPQEEVLEESLAPFNPFPDDWSRDGRYIVEELTDPKTKADIWALPLFGDRKPVPYLHADFNERTARLSPNGQWLAYNSDETRRNEIYVQSFPNPGDKYQVSTNGGSLPVWSRDGRELFFIAADRKMMAVDVKGGAKFEAGTPKPLFDVRIGAGAWFDISKDGHFLIPTDTETEQSARAPMTVVVNWPAVLKK